MSDKIWGREKKPFLPPANINFIQVNHTQTFNLSDPPSDINSYWLMIFAGFQMFKITYRFVKFQEWTFKNHTSYILITTILHINNIMYNCNTVVWLKKIKQKRIESMEEICVITMRLIACCKTYHLVPKVQFWQKQIVKLLLFRSLDYFETRWQDFIYPEKHDQ